jgi:hypothetical protein
MQGDFLAGCVSDGRLRWPARMSWGLILFTATLASIAVLIFAKGWTGLVARAVFAEVRACWTSSRYAMRLVTAHGTTFALRGGRNLLCFLATTGDQQCRALCPHISTSSADVGKPVDSGEEKAPASEKTGGQGFGGRREPKTRSTDAGNCLRSFQWETALRLFTAEEPRTQSDRTCKPGYHVHWRCCD